MRVAAIVLISSLVFGLPSSGFAQEGGQAGQESGSKQEKLRPAEALANEGAEEQASRDQQSTHVSEQGSEKTPPSVAEPDGAVVRQESASGPATSPGVRVGAELIGGVLGASLGAFGGGFLGYMLATSDESDSDMEGLGDAIITVFVGTLGAAGVMPYGVYKGGQLTGARGSLLSSYVGGAIGVGTSVLMIMGLSNMQGGSEWLLVPVFAAPFAGSIIGYEMSLDDSPDTTDEQESAGLELQPTFSVGPDGRGGMVGMGGRF